ncbi:TonB-dependent receptor domain-containing protein [Pelomonas aquatica]|jgi:iron complex outermembrane receptor protein|uniref:TonB-dependent receptor n=1 Tax=Pelomonas aquatica TaxID=431058 RepID=A0A9X4LFP6_9BURK|nr:TonB-dependent receptor [Pelomonas aquatica]MCY4754793.1 TonB-dependent receptor [Pelomonas aquatica]MDG0861894.1 TonB-dependent receptor [Pelomonas aquatica]
MLPVQYLHKSSRSRRRGSSFAALTLSALAAALSAAAHAQQVGEAKTDTEQAKAKQADAKVLEAVVITGTNIRSANLVSSAPITEVGKAIFEGTGSISIEDTLSRIPSITAGLSASSNNTSTGGDAANVGVATVSLRNLGSARTLVLVNGRRWVSGVSANTGYGVDLNSIPVAMIKRVDVLTGGQSAIYGSDAIAGVINIITKKDFNGLELNALASDSADGGAGRKSFDLTYGRNFDTGNAWVSIGQSKQEPLRSADRPFSANELRFLDTNKDGILESIAVRNGPAHVPGGALFFGNLAMFGNGNPFNTNQPLLDSKFNRLGTTDWDNQFARRYLVAPYKPSYIASGLTVDVDEKSKAEFEMNYTKTTSFVALEPAPVSAVADVFRVPQGATTGIDVATSPYFVGSRAGAQLLAAMGPNTSLDRVQTFRRLVELGDRTVSNKRETFRAAASFTHDFSDSLSWKSSAVYGTTSELQTNTGDFSIPNFRNALTIEADGKGGYRCASAQARIEGCVPINPFGTVDSLAGKAGVTGISPEAVKYLAISTGQTGVIKQGVVNSVLSGELPYAISANPINFAAGVEFRREQAEEIPDAYRQQGLSRDLQVSAISGAFSVKEAFGEIEVPVARWLNLSAAGRYGDYSTVGKNFTHRYGLNAPVSEKLRLRGSWSPRSVRAPNINDLFSNGVTNTAPANTDVCNGVTAASTGNIADNCRSIPAIANRIANTGSFALVSSEANNTRLLLAGSPALSAETAKTTTLGAVFTPMQGLSLSVDYYSIDIKNGITRLSSDVQVKNCFGVAPGSFDPTCGGTLFRDVKDGPILNLRSPLINAANITTRGVDFELGYVGHGFIGGVFMNYLDRYDVVDATGTNAVFAGRPLYPKWRITTNAGYNITDQINLFGQARYRSKTKSFLTPNAYSDDLNDMKAVTYVDLRLNYKATSQLSVYVGANNVFNVQPDINVRDPAVGTNTEPGAYDVIGRQYFVGMKLKM